MNSKRKTKDKLILFIYLFIYLFIFIKENVNYIVKKEKYTFVYVPPPWRNGLACWTSNSKVVGSFCSINDPNGGFYWCILGIFWQRFNWYFEGNLRIIFEVMFICTLLYLIYSYFGKVYRKK